MPLDSSRSLIAWERHSLYSMEKRAMLPQSPEPIYFQTVTAVHPVFKSFMLFKKNIWEFQQNWLVIFLWKWMTHWCHRSIMACSIKDIHKGVYMGFWCLIIAWRTNCTLLHYEYYFINIGYFCIFTVKVIFLLNFLGF